jgi:hypothetical protein
MLLLGLFGGWWDMPPTGRSLFLRGRLAGYAAIAAVIAYVVHPGAVTYGLIVHIGDICHIGDVIHGAVVEEGSVLPASALIAEPGVSESIVDPTVEPDLRTPVPDIPHEGVAAPAPITRSPENPNLGRLHPGARHPVVVVIIGVPRPVTRRPQITVAGNNRLLVHGQHGRSDSNGHSKLRERGSWHRQRHQRKQQWREQQRTNAMNATHFELPPENIPGCHRERRPTSSR